VRRQLPLRLAESVGLKYFEGRAREASPPLISRSLPKRLIVLNLRDSRLRYGPPIALAFGLLLRLAAPDLFCLAIPGPIRRLLFCQAIPKVNYFIQSTASFYSITLWWHSSRSSNYLSPIIFSISDNLSEFSIVVCLYFFKSQTSFIFFDSSYSLLCVTLYLPSQLVIWYYVFTQ
jgi:hypothetical protein